MRRDTPLRRHKEVVNVIASPYIWSDWKDPMDSVRVYSLKASSPCCLSLCMPLLALLARKYIFRNFPTENRSLFPRAPSVYTGGPQLATNALVQLGILLHVQSRLQTDSRSSAKPYHMLHVKVEPACCGHWPAFLSPSPLSFAHTAFLSAHLRSSPTPHHQQLQRPSAASIQPRQTRIQLSKTQNA